MVARPSSACGGSFTATLWYQICLQGSNAPCPLKSKSYSWNTEKYMDPPQNFATPSKYSDGHGVVHRPSSTRSNDSRPSAHAHSEAPRSAATVLPWSEQFATHQRGPEAASSLMNTCTFVVVVVVVVLVVVLVVDVVVVVVVVVVAVVVVAFVVEVVVVVVVVVSVVVVDAVTVGVPGLQVQSTTADKAIRACICASINASSRAYVDPAKQTSNTQS
mmetsp:Transcript_39788/g.115114  ORF Transcript_39788/g.115114 Transcript_39788/m.115114 type:complete len:217 (-) Transcript_39788:145-795(-)